MWIAFDGAETKRYRTLDSKEIKTLIFISHQIVVKKRDIY